MDQYDAHDDDDDAADDNDAWYHYASFSSFINILQKLNHEIIIYVWV